jgi:hypothetical protein
MRRSYWSASGTHVVSVWPTWRPRFEDPVSKTPMRFVVLLIKEEV